MIDRHARNKLADVLGTILEANGNPASDVQREVEFRAIKSKDRAIRIVYDELSEDFMMRLPAKPNEDADKIPPELERSIDRAILFLQTDHEYEEESYWLDTIANTTFWICLTASFICIPLLNAVNLGWLNLSADTLGTVIIAGFLSAFGLLYAIGVLWLIIAAIHIIRVRIFGQDLTAFRETEDECWPFLSRQQYEAAQETVRDNHPSSVQC
jgi:hypothetical protein